MDYKPGSRISKNVQVQQPAQTIGDLANRYGATRMEFYYPQPEGIGGLDGAPLHPKMVEGYMRRAHGYLNDQEQRIKELTGYAPKRHPGADLYVAPMDPQRRALIESLAGETIVPKNIKK